MVHYIKMGHNAGQFSDDDIIDYVRGWAPTNVRHAAQHETIVVIIENLVDRSVRQITVPPAFPMPPVTHHRWST